MTAWIARPSVWRRAFVFILLALGGFAVCPVQAQTPSDPPPSTTTYKLSPERASQAAAYARASHQLYALHTGYGFVILLLLLRLRVATRFRDWAERTSGELFPQALVFVSAFQLTFVALDLPGSFAAHWIRREYGQSIQNWGSWWRDQAIGAAVGTNAAIFVIWLLYVVIRRSPRYWWFYGWLCALPVLLFTTVVNPLLIDPLFSRYAPLAPSQPELAMRIERMAARSGQQIPQSNMFLMDASRKSNQLNAYVTGLGASRRVVIWDTIMPLLTTDEILFVFGHEMGHYVLGHILRNLAFSAGLLLASLWSGFHVLNWIMRRFSRQWALRGLEDWASLPLLMLVFSFFSVMSTPASNAFERFLEHQADQYGLEIIHGIVRNPSDVAANAFRIMGTNNLEEEQPSWLAKLWFYSHPTLNERIRFAYTYNPWEVGRSPRFVK